MRTAIFAGLLGAVIAIPAATSVMAKDVTVDTATGPVAIAANPEKLAVFDVAAIDTLAAMGVAMTGVPAPLYLDSLADIGAGAQVVGTLFEPDFETLAVMQPDLIIVGGRSSAQAAALAPIAPVIDMTIGVEGMADQARARIATYGALFGAKDKADALTAALDAKLAMARAAVKGKGKALIVLTNGGKISAYGAGSRFGWLHSDLALPEAVENLSAETHGQSVSFEFLAETDPDWLLVVDRGAAIGAGAKAAKATLDNPLVARTKAAQAGQIVYLDAAPLYIAGGGAGAMMHTLDEVIAAFGGGKEG